MSPTPTLIRQVAANGGISISVNGIARPLDEANCRLTRELVGRIGESNDPDLASFAQLVDTLRSSALGSGIVSRRLSFLGAGLGLGTLAFHVLAVYG